MSRLRQLLQALTRTSGDNSRDPLEAAEDKVPAVALPATIVLKWDFDTSCDPKTIQVTTFVVEHRLDSVDGLETYSWDASQIGPQAESLDDDLEMVSSDSTPTNDLLLRDISRTFGGEKRVSYYATKNLDRRLERLYDRGEAERGDVEGVIEEVFGEYGYDRKSHFDYWGVLDEAVETAPKYQHASRFH